MGDLCYVTLNEKQNPFTNIDFFQKKCNMHIRSGLLIKCRPENEVRLIWLKTIE